MSTVSRKYLFAAAFAGVAALGVTQAQAQGPWTGPYFGLHAGWGSADSTMVVDGGFAPFIASESIEAKGGLAGAHLGLNVQLGSIVLGGELSLSAASIDGSKGNCAPVVIGPGVTCTKEDDWLLLAMGRLGFAPSPHWMVYGTAGWAVAGVISNTIAPGLSADFFKASAVHDGLAFGVGAEYRFPIVQSAGCCGASAVLGIEYLRVDLDTQTHTPSLTVPRHVSQDIDIIRARLSIKLDMCCERGHGLK
jgi:opacity protein-like surface antigen